MQIMTANGWKPLQPRNVIAAPDQGHWNSGELRAKAEAHIAFLVKENAEMAADRISRHTKDIFAKAA
jgi:hypothetical protein